MPNDEEEKKFTVFQIIDDISFHKRNVSTHEKFEEVYSPFLINKSLSLYPDTLAQANEMNMSKHLSKKQQYDFLFYSIVKRKRFSKWPKKIAKDDNLEMVKQYFGYSDLKAKRALSLLNEQQIKKLKEMFIKGGMGNDK